MLQTQRADIGHTVDARQVTDLPLLGRRYAELAMLTTGVVPATDGISSRGEDSFFNVNGNFATWNNFTLDGAVARLREALPDRVVWGIPTRRDRRILDYWDGDQIVGFYIGAKPSDAGDSAARRACEVLSGFRGVGVHDTGQGEAVCRISNH